MELKPGFCTLCRSRCGTLNTVENGRLVAVAALPGHPTGKATCAKGRAAPEIAHSSRRLQKPLRRTRPKTDPDPGWEEISWDTALDEIAARMNQARVQHGAESVAFAVSSPSGTSMADSYEWVERFMRVFGTPNHSNATEVCNWEKDYAHVFTFGAGMPPGDWPRSDLIILWGFNPANSWLAQAGAIEDARKRGARLMVIDPRRAGQALTADYWLRVRPGTDGALALGLAHLVLRQNGHDDDFVRRWTNGPLLVRDDTGALLRASDLNASGDPGHYVVWDTLRQAPAIYDSAREVDRDDAQGFAMAGVFDVAGVGRTYVCRPAHAHFAQAVAAYPPARVAALTGIPEADLHAAAAAIAQAPRVSYHCWTGVAQHTNATQTERAIAVLYALTGCFDAPGGNVPLARQPINRANPPTLLDPVQAAKALGLERYPLGPPSQGWVTIDDVYTAILESKPYPVKVLFGFGANILVSLANTARGQAALAALDFQVHCDLFETPTARYADIVLPVNSAWEREGLRVGFEISADAEELVQLRPRMVPAQGESRSDLDIVFGLATRLGMGEAFFDGSIDAGWNHMLAPLGITVDQLRAQPAGIRRPVAQSHRKYADPLPNGEVRGFATPSRRVEIYSERLLAHGYPAVPTFEEFDEATGTDSAAAAARDAAYPYVLTTARNGYYCHSQHRGLTSLRKRAPEPVVEIADALARELGIRGGDWIALQTRVGRARFRAKVNDALHKEVLVAEYGWWAACDDVAMPGYDPFSGEGSNYNALVPVDQVDPISGAVPMRSIACAVVVPTDAATRWHDATPMRVTAHEQEVEGVVSMSLEPLSTGPLPAFQPGQHLLVSVPQPSGAPPLSRAYSLSGAVGGAAYQVGIKHVITPDGVHGAMSTHVHRSLRVGDVVQAAAPAGHFRIPTHAGFPVVLIATGIGITPFLSYLETLVLEDPATQPEVVLIYGSRNRRSHAYARRLHALAARLPRLRIVDYLSRPDADDAMDAPPFIHGRVTADSVCTSLIERRARFYLCGQEAMLDAVVGGLVMRGVPRFEIFLERFHATATAAPVTSGDFTVRFARSGRDIAWTPGAGNLLALAEAHDLALPSGCRTGQCESCAVRRLSGQIHYLVATEMDDPDMCLTCQAVPCSDLVLDA